MPAPTIINIPDPRLGEAALSILRQLRPMDVVVGRMIRRGRPNDGGYLMLDHDCKSKIAYSFGISDDVSWDLEMASLGYDIYQYDHTIPNTPVQHERFHFSRICIGGSSSVDGTILSIEDILQRNGHSDCSDIVLKMDIESAEWEALEALHPETLNCFSQILIELHQFTRIVEPDVLARIQSVLTKLNASQQVVHVHANNWGWVGFIGGVTLPDTLEVSYVKRSDHQFSVSTKQYPTKLDMPCDPNAADYFLGALGIL